MRRAGGRGAAAGAAGRAATLGGRRRPQPRRCVPLRGREQEPCGTSGRRTSGRAGATADVERSAASLSSSTSAGDAEDGGRRGDVDAHTLKLLDWENICSHVSIFTSTKLGRLECYDMELGADLDRSRRLQEKTLAVYCLEAELGKRVEFRGVDSSLVKAALRRTENGGRLSPELFNSVLALMSSMQQIQSLVKSTVQSQKGPIRDRLVPLDELTADLSVCKHLQKEISRRIDEDGRVRDQGSQVLSKLRSEIGVVERKVVNQVRNKGGTPTTHKGRVCLEIHTTELPKYEKEFLLLGNSESAGMVYVEPTTVIQMNNRLMDLRNQEDAEVDIVCWKLTAMVHEEIFELQELFQCLIKLDVTVARARYTMSIDGNWPELVDPGSARPSEKFTIRLKQLRNPLLLWEQKKAEMTGMGTGSGAPRGAKGRHDAAVAVVPVDIFVEKGVSAIVITGPNTGGKTASMKALGIVSLMSRAGLGIPASGSVILPAFDNVYGDIGDEQSLRKNLSTFSSHVTHIRDISRRCTERSLVLLDELGTGTDPMEGSALGAAIVKHFVDKSLLTICTTHFGHVSSLKFLDARVENAAVDFDPGTLRPTYQIIWGASGESNAFHIAESFGLQEEVLSEARELAASSSAAAGPDLTETLEGLKSSITACSRETRKSIGVTRETLEVASGAVLGLRSKQLDLHRTGSARILSKLEEARSRMKEIMKTKMREEAAAKRAETAKGKTRMGTLVTKVQNKETRKMLRKQKKQQQRVSRLNPPVRVGGGGGGSGLGVGSTVFVPQFKAKAVVVAVQGPDLVVQMGSVKMKVKKTSVQSV